MKPKKNWIQAVTTNIKQNGTQGVCSGSNYGGASCPMGSPRYNLATRFRKFAAARKAKQ